MKRRALISVTDKTGVEALARGLVGLDFELVSTGGTAKLLRESGLDVTEAGSLTGFGEILDGRVKTLHPAIHGGLLADVRKPEHRDQLASAGIVPIEVVVVNLYAFESTTARPHSLEEAIESIDIGGPAMIRAAAKNYANVAIVVDPADYEMVLQALSENEMADLRPQLMAKAYRHTALYDSVISRYFTERFAPQSLPESVSFGYRKSLGLRYGENPHQNGALFQDPLQPNGVARARQIWGKELSYNNLLDADAAWELVCDLTPGAVSIIKHGNPCGVACLGHAADSYRQARLADPISAFGGIAAVHGAVDKATAEAMTEKGNFLEVVIATQFDPAAAEIFQSRSGWGQSVRLLEAELSPSHPTWTVRSIRGGALIQELDEEPEGEWRVVSERAPTDEEMRALRLQWTIARHVKSNAIVIGAHDRLFGVGAGQMNRVQSVRLAMDQAGDLTRGAALASDAFFPFRDSIDTAASGGISAIIEPGGSKKDDEVIQAANEHGIALIFTGVRHFRH